MLPERTDRVVLANASVARVLRLMDDEGRWTVEDQWEHPESRLKAAELAHDRPGHVERTEGSQRSGTAFTPRIMPKQKTQMAFARELAQHMHQAVMAHQGMRWVLLASNPFLGEVKALLSPQSRHALYAALPKDLTGLEEPALRHALRELLASLAPAGNRHD
jgi:protein required for attachment to host cells